METRQVNIDDLPITPADPNSPIPRQAVITGQVRQIGKPVDPGQRFIKIGSSIHGMACHQIAPTVETGSR